MKGLEGIVMVKKNNEIIYFDLEKIIELENKQNISRQQNTSHQAKENHNKV